MTISRSLSTALISVMLFGAGWPSAATSASATTGADIVSLVEGGHLDEATKGAAEVFASDGHPDIEFARAIDRLVEASYRAGHPSDAVRAIAESNVSLKERLLGPDDPGTAESVHRLGALLQSRREFTAALVVLERALAIREHAFGPDALELTPTLTNLATVVAQLGPSSRAQTLFERCLAIRTSKLPADHPDLGPILLNFGIFLEGQGDFARAEGLLRHNLVVREKATGPESPQVANALVSLETCLHLRGDLIAAEPVLGRALAIYEKNPQTAASHLSLVRSNLAALYAELGRYEAAVRIQEDTIRVLEAQDPVDPDGLGLMLNNLGTFLLSMGDLEGAGPILDRALALRRSQLPRGPDSVAETLNNLAVRARLVGDLDGAERYSREALDILKQSSTESPVHVSQAWTTLGRVAILRGRTDEATRFLTLALSIREQALGRSHPEVAESLVALGEVLTAGREFEAARDDFVRAIAIREQVFGPDSLQVGAALERYARSRLSAGDKRGAFQLARRCERIGREQFTLLAPALQERQLFAFGGVRPTGLTTLLELASQGLPAAERTQVWDDLMASRGVVLDELTRRRETRPATTEPRRDLLEAQAAELRSRLAGLVLRGPADLDPDAYRKQLDDARHTLETVEKSTARLGGSSRSSKRDADIGLRAVRSRLPRGTALVAYSRFDRPGGPAFMAFVLSGPDAPVEVVALGPAKPLESAIAEWARSAASPGDEEAYVAAGARLRRLIWDPVMARVGSVKRLVVVPDGDLHLVNFDTLPAAGGGFLVESAVDVAIVEAERDLVNARQARAAGGTLLVFANPDFDAPGPDRAVSASLVRGNSCLDTALPQFGPLASTLDEASALAGIWSRRSLPVESRTGVEASEAAFRLTSGESRVLHVATHAFWLRAGCAPSVPAGLADVELGTARVDSMYLTGLALAGANRFAQSSGDPENDGLLTSAEIAGLDLRGVDWVILSACETGAGTVLPGEGVFGLRRAFQAAGAGTVVASLWQVQDEFAAKWMRRFYTALTSEERTPHDAVRSAELAMLHEFRSERRTTHPYYWGAFVATGR